MELQGMLRTTDASMVNSRRVSSTDPIWASREGGLKIKKTSNPKWKGKCKVGHSNPNLKNVYYDITPTSDPNEAIYFYCQQNMHWKRRCLKYLDFQFLEEIKRKKSKGIGTSSMFMINLNYT